MADHIEVSKLSGPSGEVLSVRLLEEDLFDPIIINATAAEIVALIDEGHTKLVIAFTKVRKLASGCQNALIKIKQKLDSKSGELRLCHMNQTIYDTFQVTGLDKYFVIKATEKDALADL